MDNNPFVSVIIPCYKPEKKLITRALNSVLKQSYRNFEIILVDDGNDADNKSIINNIKKIDDRIILLIQEKNGGVSKARNDATAIANGDFVCYIDCDDIVSPYFLEEAIKEIDDADLIIGGIASFKKNIVEDVFNTRNTKTEYYQDDYSMIINCLVGERKKIKNGLIGRGCWARLVRKEVAQSVKFNEDIKIAEDLIWNIDVIEKSKKVALTEQIWYLYYDNIASSTHSFDPGIEDNMIDVYNYLINNEQCKKILTNESICAFLIESISLINAKYLCNLRNQNRTEYVKECKKIYNSNPWKKACDCDYKELEKKTRVKLFLFKNHCFFGMINMYREIRKRIINGAIK